MPSRKPPSIGTPREEARERSTADAFEPQPCYRPRQQDRHADEVLRAMLNVAFLVGILALPMAGLVLTPASRTFARSGTSLVMACLLLWLLLFWSTALTFAWPLLVRALDTWPF